MWHESAWRVQTHGGEICRGRLSSLHNQWASDDRWCTRLASLLPLNNILDQKKTNIGYTPSNSWGRSMIQMLFPHVGLPWYPHWNANGWSEVSKLIGTPNISDHTIAVVKSFHIPILDDQYPNVCCFICTCLHIDGNWYLLIHPPTFGFCTEQKRRGRAKQTCWSYDVQAVKLFVGWFPTVFWKETQFFSVRPQCLQSKNMGSGFENS